jgi:hypothetical protein
MTRREKVLALCVGGTVGGLALVLAVRWVVLDPFQTVRKQIGDEQRRSQKLAAHLQQVEQVEEQWQALTAQTLAEEPRDAQRRFQENMQQLLDRHGLRDAKVAPGAFIANKDGSRGVPLTINASGTLKEIVGFLCDFYCQDYLKRLDKVRISGDQSLIGDINFSRGRPGARPGGRTAPAAGGRREPTYGPDGPELKVSISAVTLVLPRLNKIDHPVVEQIGQLENGPLQRERTAYNVIVDRNPFTPFQPKPTVVVAPTPTTQSETARPVQQTTPVVDPRAGAEQKFVRVTTCLDGEPVAYVYDQQQLQDPPAKYYLDAEIDDGRLILIHPRGLVVQVGSHKYFYPLGKSFKDREDLDPDEHPDIVEALRQEAAGSSHPPAGARAGTSG